MIEVILTMYLVGYVAFLCCYTILIAYDYISNPFPKSTKLSYKIYKILKDILVAAIICLFWPLIIVVEILFFS